MTVLFRLLATGIAISSLLGSFAAATEEGPPAPETLHVLETRNMEHEHHKAARFTHANKHQTHNRKSAHHVEGHHRAPAHPHHEQGRHHAPAHPSPHPAHGGHHDPPAGHHKPGGKRGGCKAGLGWTDNDVSQKPFQDGSCWCYNWSPWKCSTVLESVPMLWSMKQIADWNSQVKGKHWTHILAINEPEQPGQANMPPGEAVSIWWKHVASINADRRGSPAVTTSPQGFDWIVTFLKECAGCQIDFVCLHYYGTSAADFKAQVTKFYKAVRRPIWVTEWACQNYGHGSQCTAEETVEFLKETQGWMDTLDWIERYAYYGAFQEININPTNRLMTPAGHLTPLGRIYLGQ